LHHLIIEIARRAGVAVIPVSDGALGLATITIKVLVSLEAVHMIEEMVKAALHLGVHHVVEIVDIHPKVDRLVGVIHEAHSADLTPKKKKLLRILSSELWLQRSRVKTQSMRMLFGNANVTIRNMPFYCIEMLVIF